MEILKSQILIARELGKLDFEAGKKGVPYHNKTVMEMTKCYPTWEDKDCKARQSIMKAYLVGWDAANLKNAVKTIG